MKNRRVNILWTIIITCILTVSLCITASAATAATSLSVGNASGTPSAVVQVPVLLESTGDVTAAQFDLSFDQQILTYRQTSAGDLTSAFSIASNMIDNKLRVIIYSPTNEKIKAGSGSLAIIGFQVAAGASSGQSASLGLSNVILSDTEGTAISSSSIDGLFKAVGGSGSDGNNVDTVAPAWPSGSNLAAISVSQNSLTLNWTAATDNNAVTGYKIYQGGTLLGSTGPSERSYNVTGLTAGTQYTFKVEAGDAIGNWSSDGPSVTVKTTDSQNTTGSTKSTGSGGTTISTGVSESNTNTTTTPAGSTSAGLNTFVDIQKHWAQQDIEFMAGKDIVKGIADNTFAPNKNITRAEFAALLVRALAITEVKPAQGQFADIEPNAWYYSSVETAAAADLVKGLGENKYAPANLITREQMAVMIIRALANAGVNVDLGTGEQEQLLAVFNDKGKISAWSTTSLALAVKAGLINGATSSTLEPLANATRAQATVMIRRMMEKAGRL